ncbi:hypothetical protein M758_6G119200 [Ceratodon purpureus]|nr:hypothetical protein M758_6G119200 [Ceratodon purpureus]
MTTFQNKMGRERTAAFRSPHLWWSMRAPILTLPTPMRSIKTVRHGASHVGISATYQSTTRVSTIPPMVT